jgi:large subunit ribosomal protein L15
MQSNTLKARTPRQTTDRVGRGGKRGKTSGHGIKGQRGRSGRRMRPELRDIVKKLPKLRGHGKNRSKTVRMDRKSYRPVNLATLEAVFAAGDTVTPAILAKKGVISLRGGRVPNVKILGTGELTKKLAISDCAVSEKAKEAIIKAGGSAL